MKSPTKRMIVGLMLVTLLSGCATADLNDDATRTKDEGIAEGGVGGVAARSLLGPLVGGSRKVRFDQCIEALLFGGSGGYMLGSTVAERKMQYANEEDRLDGEIKVFNKQNKKLNTYNTNTAKELTDLQNKITEIELKKEETQNQPAISAHEKEMYLKRIETDKANKIKLASELSALDEYFQSIQGTGDQSKVVVLRKEIATLQKNTTILEANNAKMDQLVAAMPVRN